MTLDDTPHRGLDLGAEVDLDSMPITTFFQIRLGRNTGARAASKLKSYNRDSPGNGRRSAPTLRKNLNCAPITRQMGEVVEAMLHLGSAAFVTGEILYVDGRAHASHS